ncbi:MAG TPA: hypothetical protein VM618_13040, partial [Acidimicrobiia bacterium]|nr:hypothetical protein [Acidimicrobiia bacterium]
MIVDPVNNLGFALGQKRNQSNQFRLVMFDLVGLRQVGEMPISGLASDDIFTFAVDPETRRLIYASRPSFAPTTAVCGDTPVALVPKGTFLNVVTYDFDAAAGQGAMQLHQPGLPIPCAGRKAMQFNTMSFYEVDGKKKLLATGTYSDESYHYGHPTDFNLHDNLGQSLIIRQFDADELFARQGTLTPDPGSLEWEVDLRTVGCGRIDVHLVQRVGDSVISLCSDTRPVASYAVGEQGYVVRIPLGADHRPIPRGGTASGDPANPTNDAFIANPTVRRTPSLAGKVFPFLDPGSGRLQLLTANNANGNAVWVFDPTDERFLGVMTGGVVGQTAAKTAAGFDRDNGRAYLLTNRGILAASVRPSPLPGGQLYPVVDGEYDDAGNLVNPENVSSLAIAVAPKLRRLFVPVVDKGYVVVEDHSADPPALPPVDPDEFTNQIEEREGETEVNASGAAIASGVNIIGSGGVPRIANQLDPLCHSPHPAWETNVAPNFREQLLFNGKCLADQLATPGNRNVVIAGSKASAASGADATASSNGLAFAETDHATNRDVKELGDCGYGYMERLQQPFVWMSQQDTDPSNDHTPQSPRGQDGGFCGQVQGGLAQALGDDLRNGTHGGTGTGSGAGFPFPGAECSDFGGEPGGASAPGQSPKGAAVAANVACDSASGTASAAASAAPLAVPSPADPLVSVGKTWTDIATTRTDLGQVTVATAVAQGVRIGPLSIGEVRSLATSRAKGRTGTAAVDFERRWCGISLTEALGAVPDAGVSTPAVPGVPGGPPTSPADPVFEAGLLTNDCIDPDTDPLARQLVDELNQAVGKVRVSIPDVRADATDGGYQAVVTKHPDVRAADQAVNDDDSHTVP